MEMVLGRLILILALCLAFTTPAPAQTRMFYRIVSGTNLAITSWTGPGALAWTNAAVGGAFNIQWAFDFTEFASGSMESVEYGTVTAITMAVAASLPTTARPLRSTHRMIPEGSFLMGNSDTNLNKATESPVHNVAISAFYMDKCEVRKDLWDEVRSWAGTNGYSDLAVGVGTGGNHPAQTLTWYDCVKWCNARSERERLTPVYCTDSAKTNVYRSGTVDAEDSFVKWDANGYRLPTEAEWEKAARGGLVGQHFPWPGAASNYLDDIDGTKANYSSSGDAYEIGGPSDTKTTPIGYYNSNQVIGGIVQGSDMTNGYGLYDMAGNVSEWCWDWYSTNYYATYPTNAWPTDPPGPTGGSTRIVRGGYWDNVRGALRCANRADSPPSFFRANVGFRCVRGL
jgi:formylglycine-generating enzyme required for sulfatase activity